MELKQIKELMTAVGRSDVKRLKLKKDNFEIVIEREVPSNNYNAGAIQHSSEEQLRYSTLHRAEQALSRASEMPSIKLAAPLSVEGKKEDANSQFIVSPMVGTFYVAAAPEEPPFVKAGDKIDKNMIVCIIEAMKVMNEIKANLAGTLVEVLVESGQPVEFGTKLFRIIE